MKKVILAVVAAVGVAGSAVAQSGVRYPFVTVENGGVVVVCRDGKGGIDESSLFSSRVTESKTGNEKSSDNRLSRKFRVQKGNPGKKTWQDAVNYCNNLNEEGKTDWRLPSQRELMLIWLLGGNSNVTSGDKNDTGVGSGSIPVNTPYLYQQSGFTALSADTYWSATEYGSNSGDAWYVDFSLGTRTTSTSPAAATCAVSGMNGSPACGGGLCPACRAGGVASLPLYPFGRRSRALWPGSAGRGQRKLLTGAGVTG